MDEVLGHSLLVTSFSLFLSQLPQRIRRMIPSKLRGIKILKECNHLGVRNLTIGIPGLLATETLTSERMKILLAEELERFPILKFPYILQSLSCFEPLPKDTLPHLGSLNNLTSLNLSIFSLASVKPPKTKILLPKLTCLIISDVQTFPEFSNSSVTKTLNCVLDYLELPILNQLEVTYPIESLLELEEDSTRNVMNLLLRSARSIESLAVTIASPSQNITPPTKHFRYPENVLQEMIDLGRKLHLKVFELRDNHLHSLRPSTQVKAWTQLVKQQEALRSLKLELKSSIEFFEDVVPILVKNSRTLKNLDLSCFPSAISCVTRDISFVPIECHCLQACSVLESLRATDKLINTINLPLTLKCIKVDAMLMNVDAQDILLRRCASLDLVELKDIRGGAPKGFGYGILISTLETFVATGKVKRLIVYSGSTDGHFPDEGICNGDPVNPIKLSKRKPPQPYYLNEAGDLITPSVDYERLLANSVRIDWQLVGGYYEETPFDNQNNIQHPLFTWENLLNIF